MRVSQFLADERVSFEEMIHPPAFSSTKLAKFLRVSGHQVVKSILLKGPKGYFVAVLAATQTIDMARLTAHLGGPVRLAAEEEVSELFRDCEWGAALPFGTLYGMPTLLEADLTGDKTIVFEAQRHAVAIRMRCSDFIRLEKPTRLAFAKPIEKKPTRPRAG